MRELNLNEVSYVSGALNCIDGATFQKIHNQAVNKGIILSIFGTGLTGSLAYGVGSYALAGALGSAAAGGWVAAVGVGIAVAPWIAAYGYFTASSWDLIS